ncbi:MAG: response regulator [bacterium]|nr:response regulator [bacterium]
MISNIKAISVDDEEINLLLIEEMAKEIGLAVQAFTSPLKALEFISTNEIDLVFVDYMMPEMDGVQLIKQVRIHHPEIPIVMITAVVGDENLKLDAIRAGATEFLTKPLKGAEFTARVKNLVNLRTYQVLLMDKAKLLKVEVEKATTEIIKREHESLLVLGNAAEYKDPETGAHVSRVAHYSKMIAEELGESEEVRDLIFNASPLHDVGKIGIPDSILLKPGKLTSEEWDVMTTHARIGSDILQNATSPYLQAGAIIALSHHEKFNGKGYPQKLKGSDIHLYGRITAVADVFDALTSKRPYKDPWPFEKAVGLIEEEKGEHFDPEIADIFLNNIDRVKTIYNVIKDPTEIDIDPKT